MAMDSRIKRIAAAGTAKPYMRSQGNDATVGRGWRASVANAYPVANFQAPVAADDLLLLQYSKLRGGKQDLSGGLM